VSRFVVDASVAVKWLVPEIHAEAAGRVLRSRHELLAPDLIWAEVGNILWKMFRRGELAEETACDLLEDFQRAPLRIAASQTLMPAAWSIAALYDRSFYDSLYLALAVKAECPLVTADLKLYNRFKAGPFGPNLVWIENTL